MGADGALARMGASDPAGSGRGARAPRSRASGPDCVAAASPDPPGEHDRILLYRDAAGPTAASLPVEGAVRALASRRHGANALLAAALEDERGRIPGGAVRDGAAQVSRATGAARAAVAAVVLALALGGVSRALGARPALRRRAAHRVAECRDYARAFRAPGPGRPHPRRPRARDAPRHRRRRPPAARPRAVLGQRRGRPRVDAAAGAGDVPRRRAGGVRGRRARPPAVPAQRLGGGSPSRARPRRRGRLPRPRHRSPGRTYRASTTRASFSAFASPTAVPLAPLASPAAAIVSARGAGAGPFVPTTPPSARGVSATAFGRHVRGRPFLDVVRLVADAAGRRRPLRRPGRGRRGLRDAAAAGRRPAAAPSRSGRASARRRPRPRPHRRLRRSGAARAPLPPRRGGGRGPARPHVAGATSRPAATRLDRARRPSPDASCSVSPPTSRSPRASASSPI